VDVEGVQLDEAHSKRRPGQVEWIHTALAMKSLFVLWVAFGARTTETASGMIAQVVARLQRVPLFLTDGWKCYPVALIRVLGRGEQGVLIKTLMKDYGLSKASVYRYLNDPEKSA